MAFLDLTTAKIFASPSDGEAEGDGGTCLPAGFRRARACLSGRQAFRRSEAEAVSSVQNKFAQSI